MDWKRAMEEEQAALMRLVAMLCSLADLAERAGGRSRPVRCFALWILGYAEAVMRDLIDVPDAPPGWAPICPAHDGPGEAIRLALSFRALARQLDRQARLVLVVQDEACHQGGRPTFGPCPMPAIRRVLDALSALSVLASLGPRPLLAPDTS
jgi:hypothetical protein